MRRSSVNSLARDAEAMPQQHTSRPAPGSELSSVAEHLGPRIKAARLRRGLGLRELAREVSCSPSMISQIENGITMPSVPNLYAICTALGISTDSLVVPEMSFGRTSSSSRGQDGAGQSSPSAHGSKHLSPENRRVITLERGVQWELLTPTPEQGAEFREVTYAPGGGTSPSDPAIRHNGREYCLVLEGELTVHVGFEEYHLSPGHSIVFDSTTPHRVWNAGHVPVRSVWFVMDGGHLQGSD